MSERTNAAMRARQILSVARTYNGKERSALSVWGNAFGVADPGGVSDPIEVARLLGMLVEQLEDVLEEMSQSSFPRNLYFDYINNIFQAIDVSNLSQRWSGPQQHLGEIQIQTLAWCENALESTEELIEKETLEELINDLEQFEKSVEEGSLPEYAKSFIRSQILTIEQAVIDYRVIGAKAFRHASVECLYELIENQQTFTDHRDTVEMGELRRFLQRLQQMAEKSGPWIVLGQGFTKILEAINSSSV